MQNSSINWIYLKDRLCPKCMFKLVSSGLLDPTFACSNGNCDFRISEQKFKEVLDKMLNKPKDFNSNQEALNNLDLRSEEDKEKQSWGEEPEEETE